MQAARHPNGQVARLRLISQPAFIVRFLSAQNESLEALPADK